MARAQISLDTPYCTDLSPIRDNNFPKSHARQSKILLKVGQKCLFRPMDRYFCSVIDERCYD